MAFEPQNKLEQSLIRAATDPAHRPQFYRDFVEADIFIIQYGPPPAREERKTLASDYELKIQPIEHEGKPYLPIFSSLARLQAVIPGDVRYLALNALEFLKITKGAELILNPGSEYGKEFTRAEIASILDGSLWKPAERYEVRKPTEVLIGHPRNYPTELVEALRRLFRRAQQVSKAYLAHFFNPERDEKPHTLIALEVTGDWERIASEAGLVARNVKVPDPPVDFMQITGSGGVEDYFSKGVEPFYTRASVHAV